MIMMDPKKFLIIQTAFVGDAILSTSLVELIKKEFPQAMIHILVRNGNEILFENNPLIEKIHVWNKTHNKYLNLFRIIKTILAENKNSNHFDVIINLQRFFSTAVTSWLIGKKSLRLGFDHPLLRYFYTHYQKHQIGILKNSKGNEFLHEVQRNAQFISLLKEKWICPNLSELKPRIYIQNSHFEKIDSLLKENNWSKKCYFVLAPASIWATKTLPPNKWQELIKLINGEKRFQDWPIFLIGAKNDFDYLEDIKQSDFFSDQLKNKLLINLAGKLSLLESAAAIEQAYHTYANDSAPTHLASSLDASISTFYCSTVAEFGYHPLGSKSSIIQAPPLPCRPCGIHGHKKCPQGHFLCAFNIVIDEKILPDKIMEKNY